MSKNKKLFLQNFTAQTLSYEEPQGRRAAFISSSETLRETLKSLKLQLVWRSQTFKFNQALTGSPEVDVLILLPQQSKDFHTVVSERDSRSTDANLQFVSPRFGW